VGVSGASPEPEEQVSSGVFRWPKSRQPGLPGWTRSSHNSDRKRNLGRGPREWDTVH
jgi:hypothetical protein